MERKEAEGIEVRGDGRDGGIEVVGSRNGYNTHNHYM